MHYMHKCNQPSVLLGQFTALYCASVRVHTHVYNVYNYVLCMEYTLVYSFKEGFGILAGICLLKSCSVNA